MIAHGSHIAAMKFDQLGGAISNPEVSMCPIDQKHIRISVDHDLKKYLIFIPHTPPKNHLLTFAFHDLILQKFEKTLPLNFT
ncbi:hypothetical protein [Burkholderia sp. BCC1977]|uniref:hypothetical protein n=1 Tax=Burkholderia sp. BCC1977 TaxID=2817440 RepID=UPI002ABD3A24|nr:hypothetical protein [Burkholderia sp. BCC1977]